MSEKIRLGPEDISFEIKRQSFHISLILVWLAPVLLFPPALTFLTFITVIAINLAVVLRIGPIYRVFSFLVKHLEREKNLEKPGIQALYANLGVFLSFLLFGELSVVGIIVLSIGDALSTLVGKSFGRHRVFFNTSKSWEGTVAFFLGSFAVLDLITDHRTALLTASLTAILEALDLRLDDNLLIPLFATSLVYLV